MNLTNTLCQSRFPQEYITSMTWHPPMKCAPVIFTSLPALYSECTNPQPHKATQFPMFVGNIGETPAKHFAKPELFQNFSSARNKIT